MVLILIVKVTNTNSTNFISFMSEWSAHIGAETMAATCKNGGLNNKVLYDVVFAANQSLRPLPAEQKKAFFASAAAFTPTSFKEF